MSHQALGLTQPAPSSSRIAEAAPRLHCEARSPLSQTLGIVSGKGGVGKSTLALNLALAASQQGAEALLVDGDAGLANLDLLMGIAPRYDLSDWRAGRVPLSQVLCSGGQGLDLLVVGSDGGCAPVLAAALAGRGDQALAALLARPALTLIDLGAGIGPGVLDVAPQCSRVWLVATPEPTSLADAYATAKCLWARKPDLEIELIVNRTSDRAMASRTHQALDRLTRRFLNRSLPLRGVLPDDRAMLGAVARQTPVLADAPQAVISTRLRALAESLLDQLRSASAFG